jgi:hypothetical protein
VGEDRQDRQDRQGHSSTERVSVPQAADHLGTTVDAIRKRVQRGTIPHEKDRDGRVWILLDTGRPRQDSDQDTVQPQSDSAALISEMRAHNATLQAQLEAERQAHAEARRLLMAALERIPPQLEAPQEARESTQTVEQEQELDTERARREMAESTMREGMDEERRRREEAERERDDLRRDLYGRREARESPETVEEQQGRGEPHSATGGAREGVRRPFWRRIFGG